MGVVRLRLARFGSRNRPFYRVVAIDSRKARDSQPIENVSARERPMQVNTYPVSAMIVGGNNRCSILACELADWHV